MKFVAFYLTKMKFQICGLGEFMFSLLFWFLAKRWCFGFTISVSLKYLDIFSSECGNYRIIAG